MHVLMWASERVLGFGEQGGEAETCSLTSGPQVLTGGPGSLPGQGVQGQQTH